MTTTIQYCVDWPIQKIGIWAQSLKDIKYIIDENNALKNELVVTKSELQNLDIIIKENKELRNLLHDDSKWQSKEVILANLLAISNTPSFYQYTINKGNNHGVVEGKVVLDAKGVVGRVVKTYNKVSEIMLITDPASMLSVQNKRNGISGIVVGNGSNGTLSLINLPSDVEIKKGDQFITSGLDDQFPFGYIVGTVSKLDRTSGDGFAIIELKPVSLLNRLRYVLLLGKVKQEKGVG